MPKPRLTLSEFKQLAAMPNVDIDRLVNEYEVHDDEAALAGVDPARAAWEKGRLEAHQEALRKGGLDPSKLDLDTSVPAEYFHAMARTGDSLASGVIGGIRKALAPSAVAGVENMTPEEVADSTKYGPAAPVAMALSKGYREGTKNLQQTTDEATQQDGRGVPDGSAVNNIVHGAGEMAGSMIADAPLMAVQPELEAPRIAEAGIKYLPEAAQKVASFLAKQGANVPLDVAMGVVTKLVKDGEIQDPREVATSAGMAMVVRTLLGASGLKEKASEAVLGAPAATDLVGKVDDEDLAAVLSRRGKSPVVKAVEDVVKPIRESISYGMDTAKDLATKGVRDMFVPMEDALKMGGKHSNKLADDLVNTTRDASIREQEARLVTHNMRKDLTPDERVLASRVVEGAVPVENVSPKVAEYAAKAKELLGDVGKEAEAGRLQVRDFDKEGRPIQRDFIPRPNYLPHVRENMAEDKVLLTRSDPALGTKQGNLRHARYGEGDHVKDLADVLDIYLPKAYRDLEEHKNFVQPAIEQHLEDIHQHIRDGKILMPPDTDIESLTDAELRQVGRDMGIRQPGLQEAMQSRLSAAGVTGEDPNLMKDAMQKELGAGRSDSQSEGAVAANITTLQAATKMTFSAIGDFDQFNAVATKTGFPRTGKFLLQVPAQMAKFRFGGTPSEDFMMAVRSGAALESIVGDLSKNIKEGPLGKITKASLVPFKYAEEWLRLTSAMAGQEYAKDLAKVATGQEVSWVRKLTGGQLPVTGDVTTKAEFQLRKMGVQDWEHMRETGQLSDADVKRAGYYMSHHTQYGTRPIDLPNWWTGSPWKRVLVQFQAVPLKLAHTMAKDIVAPLSPYGAVASGGRGFRMPDARPLGNAALGAAVFGGTVAALKDITTGKPLLQPDEYIGQAVARYGIQGIKNYGTNNVIVSKYNDLKDAKAGGVVSALGGVSARSAYNVLHDGALPLVRAAGEDGSLADKAGAVWREIKGDEDSGKRGVIAKLATREISLVSRVQQFMQNKGAAADEKEMLRMASDIPNKNITARLLKVIDGDTVIVMTELGPRKIRLQGIDAPETAHASGEVDQPGGPEASVALNEKLRGRDLNVEPIKPSYDRTVASIQADGKDVGYEMVKDGHAYDLHLDQSFLDRIKFSLTEWYAHATGKGLFGQPGDRVNPEEWRKKHKLTMEEN